MLCAAMGRAARKPMPPSGDANASTLSRNVTLSDAFSLRGAQRHHDGITHEQGPGFQASGSGSGNLNQGIMMVGIG